MLTYLLTYLHNLDTGTVIDSHDMTAHLSLLRGSPYPMRPSNRVYVVYTSYIYLCHTNVWGPVGGEEDRSKRQMSRPEGRWFCRRCSRLHYAGCSRSSKSSRSLAVEAASDRQSKPKEIALLKRNPSRTIASPNPNPKPNSTRRIRSKYTLVNLVGFSGTFQSQRASILTEHNKSALADQ